MAYWNQRKAAKRNARPESRGRIPKPHGYRNGFEKAFSGICPLSPIERDEILTRGYSRRVK